MGKNKGSKVDKKKLKEIYKKEVPEEIRVLFGKFIVFSILYLIFFGGIYPFFLVSHFHKVNLILILVFLSLFYVFIIIDVIRKKKHFNSILFVILLLLVIISISFSIVKLVI